MASASFCETPLTFLVSDDRMVLRVRKGLPLALLSPGLHHLPSGRMEVRLVKAGSADRSLLYIDGELVAMRDTAGAEGTAIHAWEAGLPGNPWGRSAEGRPMARHASWLKPGLLSLLAARPR